MHALEENSPVSDNEWEQIKKGGDVAIRRWIDGQLFGKSCLVVLVGSGTANRKWINYELQTAWAEKKGVLGIRIHGLKDRNGDVASRGANPFDYVNFPGTNTAMSQIVSLKDPTSMWGSSDTYASIKGNIAGWVEEAIRLRDRYK
jgi:hypothetical protein